MKRSHKFVHYLGRKFGDLTVVAELGWRLPLNGGAKRRMVLCECACGEQKEMGAGTLKSRTHCRGAAHRKRKPQAQTPIRIHTLRSSRYRGLTALEIFRLARQGEAHP